ncbi:MAG: amino acid ABC transporter ATP-binding protein [Tropicimonas sp.]|uniref:amino acid ABC transporter ATP-binding protein n=1 Tax=Tropicimonas sp. TaxID=2067044 RepID=UPI003A8A0783
MIELTNIRKAFDRTEVLRDVDFDIRKGETVALIGPSGSGKSTLLRSINLMTPPDSGRMVIDGQVIFSRGGTEPAKAVSGRELRALRRTIGMVFQQSHLFTHRNVIDNVMEGPVHVLGRDRAEARREAMDLLEELGLGDLAERYPAELSGGQQQRVSICRALAIKPKIMLFDEPTSALDPELVGEVLLTVRRIADSGMTIAIVTHEMSFARHVANRIAFLDQGKVVEFTGAESFFTAPRSERVRSFLSAITDPFANSETPS